MHFDEENKTPEELVQFWKNYEVGSSGSSETYKVMLHSNVPWYNDEIANLEMRFRQRLKGKINGILLVSRTTDHATFNNVE